MGYNVAIDGPAGAGKSTIAKRVAKEKGYIYVDTGAMYRALAVYFLDKKINPENLDAIAAACEGAEVKIQYEQGEQQVYLNGENITSRLRNEEVGNMASKVSAVPEVRAHLLNLQKELARTQDVVMDGRDIGTCVLPEADVKIFLTASVETRALRRYKELEEKGALIDRYYHDVEKEAMRRCILDEGKRLDGRKTTEIRPIWCEVGYLPGPHGSAIFTRGETQSLTSVTLGTKLDEKIVDDVLDQHRERFLLHYNFPPYSTGEAKAQRGVGRREIGHGHLAWRALKGQIPAGYPYTVRVVSDIMESNGSSSMATVCAGTLALMDAGVAMKKPVSGIAMGLIKNAGEEKYAVLSDILGDEDHLGDMDFKVTGTRDGITATQMDIKVDGLSFEILEKALLQAKEGREHILNKLTECIAEPRKDLKPHAPRIETMTIPKEFIGAIIGPGGKIIQGMQEETGATITIEETDGVGRIEIAGTNKKCIDDAMRIIKGIVAVPEVGEVYVGKVRSVMPYGVFVEFLPGKDGLLHISEIDWKRLETIEEAGLKEGDEIEVKLLDIDPKTGKFKLSHKVLLPRPEKQEKK